MHLIKDNNNKTKQKTRILFHQIWLSINYKQLTVYEYFTLHKNATLCHICKLVTNNIYYRYKIVIYPSMPLLKYSIDNIVKKFYLHVHLHVFLHFHIGSYVHVYWMKQLKVPVHIILSKFYLVHVHRHTQHFRVCPCSYIYKFCTF